MSEKKRPSFVKPRRSLVLVVATMLLPVADIWVHGLIVFSTTVAIVALFLLLFDLDHPFTGFFGIEKRMLKDIKTKLKLEQEQYGL